MKALSASNGTYGFAGVCVWGETIGRTGDAGVGRDRGMEKVRRCGDLAACNASPLVLVALPHSGSFFLELQESALRGGDRSLRHRSPGPQVIGDLAIGQAVQLRRRQDAQGFAARLHAAPPGPRMPRGCSGASDGATGRSRLQGDLLRTRVEVFTVQGPDSRLQIVRVALAREAIDPIAQVSGACLLQEGSEGPRCR